MTVIVLGVDGLDYQLAKRWGCSNLMGAHNKQLQTAAYSVDVPATLEVWPTIATGVPPEQHGVTVAPQERDADPLQLRIARRVYRNLPTTLRELSINIIPTILGNQLPVTKLPTVFDSGAVNNWPGVTACDDWNTELRAFRKLNSYDISTLEFESVSYPLAAKHIAWASKQATRDLPIAGVHVHYLDSMGHIYAERPKQLRERYEAFDSIVGELCSTVNQLVILSDHGMQTTELNDPTPGDHSMRAMVSTCVDTGLPSHITEVRNWLEGLITDELANKQDSSVDTPKERLENLGYL